MLWLFVIEDIMHTIKADLSLAFQSYGEMHIAQLFKVNGMLRDEQVRVFRGLQKSPSSNLASLLADFISDNVEENPDVYYQRLKNLLKSTPSLSHIHDKIISLGKYYFVSHVTILNGIFKYLRM